MLERPPLSSSARQTAHERASGAERARRHRARRRAGLVPRRIEVDEDALFNMLVDSEQLTAEQAANPRLQEQALSAMVAEIISRWRNAMTR